MAQWVAVWRRVSPGGSFGGSSGRAGSVRRLALGLGSAATPNKRVVTYVTQNPVEPYSTSGWRVSSSVRGFPKPLALAEVPDSEYYYVYINGTRVLVEREQRRKS